MNGVVEQIVSERIPCIFVSPHLDDAALSAGGLISYLRARTEVQIVNVFTKAEDGPATVSARTFLKQCEYTDAQKLYADRVKEDSDAFAQLGISPINLGYVEALWRKVSNPRAWRRACAHVLPELVHVYPIYRLHIARRNIPSAFDAKLMQRIAHDLQKIIASHPDVYIFCPIAIGSHVDHALVRDVCVTNFNNVFLWQDFPYSVQRTQDAQAIYGMSHDAFEWSSNTEEKASLVARYESQFRALFGDAEVEFPIEKYYQPLKAEIA